MYFQCVGSSGISLPFAQKHTLGFRGQQPAGARKRSRGHGSVWKRQNNEQSFAYSIILIARKFDLHLGNSSGRNRFVWLGPDRDARYLLAAVAMSRRINGERNRSML